jgi:hypothetical protein
VGVKSEEGAWGGVHAWPLPAAAPHLCNRTGYRARARHLQTLTRIRTRTAVDAHAHGHVLMDVHTHDSDGSALAWLQRVRMAPTRSPPTRKVAEATASLFLR